MESRLLAPPALTAFLLVGPAAGLAQEKDPYPVETVTIKTGTGDIRSGASGILGTIEKRMRGRGKALDPAELKKVPLRVEVTTYTGEIDLDLTGLNVRELDVHSDTGDVRITLPATGSTSGKVDTRTGNISFLTPTTRTIQIDESKTETGELEVSSSLNQAVDGSNPARFTLVSKNGDIKFQPAGATAKP